MCLNFVLLLCISQLGKYALAITTNKNMPEVYRFIYGVLNIWKEPMQAALPELMLSYKMGMKVSVLELSLIIV